MPRAPTVLRLALGSGLAFGLGLSLSAAIADPARLQLAQDQIRIPTEADLDRIDRQDMRPAPPAAGPATTGSIDSEIKSMDREDREVDDRVMKGICRGCD